MNLFSFFQRKAPEAREKSSTGTWQILGTGASHTAQNILEANREWVYIAVDKVANSASSVRLKVMKYNAGEDDREVDRGPLVDWLASPSNNFTTKDFVYLNTAYKELTGNAFWEVLDANDLMPLLPQKVEPIMRGRELIGYKYHDGATPRSIIPEKMLHDRYVDPARPHWGIGRLQKISRWVDTSSMANEFLSRFFLNGATFGGFLETDEDSEERIKLIKAGLLNDHVGVENAHKLGVLPKGTKYAKTTANMAELEMGATDDRYRDKILSAFGVPKTLVGLTTEVNRASAEASEYIFARYTIAPIIRDLVEFLNTQIAPRYDASGRTYFSFDEFVPVNQEIELKAREVALNRQAYKTVNEVRAEEGLPPVPGGDVIYGTAAQVPLGTPAPVLDPAAAPEPDPAKKAARIFLPKHVRQQLTKDDAKTDIVDTVLDTLKKKVSNYHSCGHEH